MLREDAQGRLDSSAPWGLFVNDAWCRRCYLRHRWTEKHHRRVRHEGRRQVAWLHSNPCYCEGWTAILSSCVHVSSSNYVSKWTLFSSCTAICWVCNMLPCTLVPFIFQYDECSSFSLLSFFAVVLLFRATIYLWKRAILTFYASSLIRAFWLYPAFFAHRHGCSFLSNKYESVYRHALYHDMANKGWMKENILTTSSAVWSTVFADNTHLLLQQPPVIRKDLPADVINMNACTGQRCSFCFNIDGSAHGNKRHHTRQVQKKCPFHVNKEASYEIITHAVKVNSIYRYDVLQKRFLK